MKYVKKILYFLGFVSTGILLYILYTRYKPGSTTGIDEHIKQLHESDKRIENGLDKAKSESHDITDRIRSARADNSKALDIVSKLEATNDRFYRLLREISQGTND